MSADTHQILASRRRRARRLRDRELLVAIAMAAGLVAIGAVLAAGVPGERAPGPLVAVGLVLAFAALSRIQFEAGPGVGVPTQLAFVPMLFALPLGWVPLAVAAGYVVGEVVGRGPVARRLLLAVGGAWFAVGPVVVLALTTGEAEPTAAHAWAYALALVAQLAVDTVTGAIPDLVIQRIRPRLALGPLLWIWALDTLLSPVGLAFAVAMTIWPLAFAAALPLGLLLTLFARERRGRIDHALELSRAYRGTALLLGDVVEADDAYTGLHTHGVVRLARAVATSLGLGADALEDVEFAALLHDVGKIRIPKEILHKPGPLDADEWAVMRTHSELGAAMLEGVGGALARVAPAVRHHHERWDGTGYPAGLAGETIPLAARIVAACDTLDAITTSRPYRAARPLGEAIAELQAAAGTQLDPAVVAAVIAIVEAGAAADALRPAA